MMEMSLGMEECRIPAWVRNKMSLANAGILHSSKLEMSEDGLVDAESIDWSYKEAMIKQCKS
jgi:hypothetical protein